VEDKELLALFTDMTRIHTAYVEHRLLHLGLHTGQGAIISALGECGPCSQKELAEYRHVSAATISVMLRRMEKSGLVARTLSEDGKCNQISLTPEGLKLSQALGENMIGEPERVFAGLTSEDKFQAQRLFEQISKNLDAMTNG
jgi:DNA-binding MarR family transcriptional regulator